MQTGGEMHSGPWCFVKIVSGLEYKQYNKQYQQSKLKRTAILITLMGSSCCLGVE